MSAYLDSAGSAKQQNALADTPRPPWLGQRRAWEFTGVVIESPIGALAEDPLQISLSYRCHSDVDGVGIRVAICHPNGTFIATIHSTDDGTRFRFRAGESGEVRLVLESPRLEPGLYVLSLHADANGIGDLDSLMEALQFEVLAPAGDSAEPALATRGRSLGLRLDARWSTGDREP